MTRDRTMKRNSEHIEAEVSKTLELLNEIPQVQVSGRFRTQLLRRIDSMEQPQGTGATAIALFSPKVAFLMLLLMLNIASAILLLNNDDSDPASSPTSALAEHFSEDYGGQALSYYDDQLAFGR